ncbi:MAG: hypothetical protein ACTSYA_11500 [Candidatus Kariarchaeaceae archaeon]
MALTSMTIFKLHGLEITRQMAHVSVNRGVDFGLLHEALFNFVREETGAILRSVDLVALESKATETHLYRHIEVNDKQYLVIFSTDGMIEPIAGVVGEVIDALGQSENFFNEIVDPTFWLVRKRAKYLVTLHNPKLDAKQKPLTVAKTGLFSMNTGVPVLSVSFDGTESEDSDYSPSSQEVLEYAFIALLSAHCKMSLGKDLISFEVNQSGITSHKIVWRLMSITDLTMMIDLKTRPEKGWLESFISVVEYMLSQAYTYSEHNSDKNKLARVLSHAVHAYNSDFQSVLESIEKL